MTSMSLTAGKLSGNEGIKNIVTLSGSIAHELRNHLTAIMLCAELSEIKLRDIKQRVKNADYLIYNLLLQIKSIVAGKSSTEGFIRYSIAKNVKEALEQYPFCAGEKELVTVAAGDFEYTGNPVLTNHVLYNLIKNSLRAIKNADTGKITIKLESGVKYNKLIFKDNATGIPKEFLSKIFGLFESQMVSQGGTGIGLAFCKLTMKSYGGDITCNSVEGEYAEFTLKFPRVRVI